MANPRRRTDRRPASAALAISGVVALFALVASGAFGLAGPASPGPAASGPIGALASPANGPASPAGPSTEPTPPSPSLASSAPASGEPSPASDEPAEPTPGDAVVVEQIADVPIVPVTQYRTTIDSVTLAETKATLAGTSKRFKALELVETEADAILARLGLERPASGTGRLLLAKDSETLAADLAAHRDRLAFTRADAVGPSVRALAWGADALFGVSAVEKLADWPLTARLPSSASAASGADFDPSATWTLVAGGDILLDRGIHTAVRVEKRGVDFPFAGGYADITSRYCCSSFGWKLPKAKRAGGAGAVRELLQGADLAIANFENPAPDKWSFHQHGTVFSAEPAKIEGLADAGLDWVSLANNHIRDAGGNGIIQTRKNLAKWGIAFGGAGKDLAEARKPSLLKVGDVTVAILAYDTIAKYYAATADRAGSAQMSAKAVRDDVKAARAAGADVVIVFPHWGVEYQASATKTQRSLGKAAIDAGADLVIGNHPHWAGAMEVYKGKPIWYALGNFVFDQTWSEPTMEGMTLELTFEGKKLVQAWMHPHLILDRAQPNLLDPAGDGKVVMDQVYKASKALLPW
jgi:hypothetical protein